MPNEKAPQSKNSSPPAAAQIPGFPDPGRFGLTSFAEILPSREPMVGELPGAFVMFHQGMMQSLAPVTPYECVIAESVIDIEWELLQRRRMRDISLRRNLRKAICAAVVAEQKAEHEEEISRLHEEYMENGGDQFKWKSPFEFDKEAAEDAGEVLAKRAFSQDVETQNQACEEIRRLGMDPVELMEEAYRDARYSTSVHEDKIDELEERRRSVNRDFDKLVNVRPIEGDVVEQ